MRLPRLSVLRLDFNQLSALPDDLGSACPALAQLYAAANRLAALPASLAAAPLTDAFLSENRCQHGLACGRGGALGGGQGQRQGVAVPSQRP